MFVERYWYIAARSADLRRGPLQSIVLGRRIALFRGPAGRPAAIEDRCAHRGAPLSGGVVAGDHIACPYHGWQYDAGGRVAVIPSAPEERAAHRNYCVPSFGCVEQDGFVWVNLSAAPALDRPPSFPFFGQRGWSSFVMRTFIQAPVEACLENFLDCPHAATVHKSWFRTPTAKVVRTAVRTLQGGAEAEYFDEPREKSLVWALLAPSREHRMRHTDRFIAPSTTQVDYQFSNNARYLITSSCTPVDDGSTLVYTVITFRFGWLTPAIRIVFQPLARLIIRQDVNMLRRVHENNTHFGVPRYAVIPQDLLLPHIIQWRNAIKTGGPAPEPGRETYVDLRL